MPASLEVIRTMLASVSKDTMDAMGRTNSAVTADLSLKGRSGDARLRIMSERAIDIFREAANTMATKARAYAGGAMPGGDTLLDQMLEELIKSIISTYFVDGWDGRLRPELTRLKVAAIMDMQHLPSEMPIGMSFHVSSNQGNINVAAGTGSVASLAVNGTQLSDVSRLIDQINAAISAAPLTDAQRLELQDHVEVLEIEVGKPSPDQGKLLRAAKRIADFGEKATIAAVGPAVTALIKYLGG